MIRNEPIFLGAAPRRAREYVARFAAHSGKPYYNPCAGAFSVVEALVAERKAATEIFASDIGLYSSIIGYLADPSKKLADLGIEIADESLRPEKELDSLDFAAHVMLILKLNQQKRSNLRGLYLREAQRRSWTALRSKLRLELEALTKRIAGIHFEIRDMWEVIREARDKDVVLFASVPHFSKGYEKMFPNHNLTWNAPQVSQFSPKMFTLLFDQLGDAKCHALLVRTSEATDTFASPWHVAFAEPEGHRIVRVLSNRKIPIAAVSGEKTKKIEKFPIYDGHDLTPASKITVKNVGKGTGAYYRDLFCHRLGATIGDMCFLLFIDGQVTTSFALTYKSAARVQTDTVFEEYGITRTIGKYKRLGKLFMLLLTCGEMRDRIAELTGRALLKPTYFQTSSITVHHEGKTDRSVLKLVERELLKDGRYRLVYRGEFSKMTFEEVLTNWLSKHAKQERA